MIPAFLPGAIVVAWGIDRLYGSKAAKLSPAVVVVAAGSVLLVVKMVGLRDLAGWVGNRSIGSPVGHWITGYLGALHRDWPFGWSQGVFERGTLPYAALYVSSSAMMLSASSFTAANLVRLGHDDSAPSVAVLTTLFAVQAAGTYLFVRAYGPVGAPLAATVACAVAFLLQRVASARPSSLP